MFSMILRMIVFHIIYIYNYNIIIIMHVESLDVVCALIRRNEWESLLCDMNRIGDVRHCVALGITNTFNPATKVQ